MTGRNLKSFTRVLFKCCHLRPVLNVNVVLILCVVNREKVTYCDMELADEFVCKLQVKFGSVDTAYSSTTINI